MGKNLRPKQCKHCETAIAQLSETQTYWTHLWSGKVECISVATKRLLSTYAAPRPAK